MARVIAVSNLKGGSAKSTTTIAVGAELAATGHPTLLIDLDGQGHLAEGFGIDALSLDHDISEVLDGSLSLQHVVRPLRPNLYLAPSNLHLAYMEPRIITRMGRETLLRKALEPMLPNFDYVLLDCPPSVGIYTVNAFVAASEVLVPMTADYFSLIGVSMLLKALAEVRLGLGHDAKVLGIVPTRVSRNRVSQDVVEEAKRKLASTHRIFTPIPEGVAVRESAAAGKPVTEYAPSSKPAEAYRALTKDILNAS